MKKIILIFFMSFIFTWGCASGGKIMTAKDFSEVSIGMTEDELQKKFGKPYSINKIDNEEVEYIYNEKETIGRARVLQEKHYLIILKNGRVSSTNVRIFNRPIYERNSYEMQTSLNN